MEETKEVKNEDVKKVENSKEKSRKKAKRTIGNIVFTTAIIVIMFFIVLFAYTYYIAG